MADNIGIRTTENVIQGIDAGGKIKEIGVSGIRNDALKTSEENSNLLEEVVRQLKINNQILNEVHDLYVNETDIK